MVKWHTEESWLILYIKWWIVAPFQIEYGIIVTRASGIPQGGVICPVLSNLFLHYVFDDFLANKLKLKVNTENQQYSHRKKWNF